MGLRVARWLRPVICFSLFVTMVVTPSFGCDISGPHPRVYLRQAEWVFRGRIISYWAHRGRGINSHAGQMYIEASFQGILRVEQVFKGRPPGYVHFTAYRGNSCAIRHVRLGDELYFVEPTAAPAVHLRDEGPFPWSHYPNAWWKNRLALLGLREQFSALRRAAKMH